jgi:hypothetical protein
MCCAPAPAAEAASCCGPNASAAARAPSFHDGVASFFQDVNLNDYSASVKIFAVKPEPR